MMHILPIRVIHIYVYAIGTIFVIHDQSIISLANGAEKI